VVVVVGLVVVVVVVVLVVVASPLDSLGFLSLFREKSLGKNVVSSPPLVLFLRWILDVGPELSQNNFNVRSSSSSCCFVW